jgi:superfamily I DNA/RNA helicase
MIAIDDKDAYREILNHHNMIDDEFQGPDVENAIVRAIKVLQANNNDTKTIDFNDMIYLCLVHPCRFDQYDVVIVDECQDQNICRREISKKLMN